MMWSNLKIIKKKNYLHCKDYLKVITEKRITDHRNNMIKYKMRTNRSVSQKMRKFPFILQRTIRFPEGQNNFE